MDPHIIARYGFVAMLLLLGTFQLMLRATTSKRIYWIPEATLLMICGILITLVYQQLSDDWKQHPPEFNANLFYYLLLPPIIFNTGLDIDFSCFQQNLLTILVYANLGTAINAIVVCFCLYFLGQWSSAVSTPISIAEGISFGALISATDPIVTLVVFDRLAVEKNLFGIVIGVSILDDAVAVVIFDLFNGLISESGLSVSQCLLLSLEFFVKSGGSMFLGYGIGYLFARLLKGNNSIREKPPLFFATVSGFLFLTYYVGDGFWFSGIITTLFSAIYFRRFYEKDHKESYEKLKEAVGGISYLLESLVFVQIGMSLFTHQLRGWSDGRFLLWSILACLIGRAAQIYPLAWLLNCYNTASTEAEVSSPTSHSSASSSSSSTSSSSSSLPATVQKDRTVSAEVWIKRGVKLSLGYQHMIFLAGLRGPIAYATAQLFNDSNGHRNLIAATTAITVVATTFVFGVLTWPALQWFDIPHEHSEPEDEGSHTEDDEESLSRPTVCSSCCFVGVGSMARRGRQEVKDGYDDDDDSDHLFSDRETPSLRQIPVKTSPASATNRKTMSSFSGKLSSGQRKTATALVDSRRGAWTRLRSESHQIDESLEQEEGGEEEMEVEMRSHVVSMLHRLSPHPRIGVKKSSRSATDKQFRPDR